MKTINIIDTGCDRYTIKSDCYFLGRQWDNLAEQMQIIIPEREKDHTCTMIVSADGVVIDHLDIKNEPKDITDVLSRHLNIEISFTFTDINGYVKNSQIKEFYFAESRKPEDFIPSEPEQSSKLDIVLGNAFIRAEVENDILKFYNANGDLSQEIVIAEGVTEYNELDGKPSINGVELVGNKTTEELGIVSKETDPTVPSWAKNPNKPTYSYDEIIGKPNLFSGSYNDLSDKPTIPSTTGLASETYVNNKASTTLQEAKNYADTKVSNLVGSAPSTLDTLAEIASALNNNPNVVTALNNSIASKQNATDNSLQTSSKTIVGAINEINGKISSANTQLQNILGV